MEISNIFIGSPLPPWVQPGSTGIAKLSPCFDAIYIPKLHVFRGNIDFLSTENWCLNFSPKPLRSLQLTPSREVWSISRSLAHRIDIFDFSALHIATIFQIFCLLASLFFPSTMYFR
jgi:hypothetical protein